MSISLMKDIPMHLIQLALVARDGKKADLSFDGVAYIRFDEIRDLIKYSPILRLLFFKKIKNYFANHQDNEKLDEKRIANIDKMYKKSLFYSKFNYIECYYLLCDIVANDLSLAIELFKDQSMYASFNSMFKKRELGNNFHLQYGNIFLLLDLYDKFNLSNESILLLVKAACLKAKNLSFDHVVTSAIYNRKEDVPLVDTIEAIKAIKPNKLKLAASLFFSFWFNSSRLSNIILLYDACKLLEKVVKEAPKYNRRSRSKNYIPTPTIRCDENDIKKELRIQLDLPSSSSSSESKKSSSNSPSPTTSDEQNDNLCDVDITENGLKRLKI